MKIELESLLEETLKEFGKIKFDLTYVNKGCIVELEIGDKKNEECGSIYDELSEWLSYGEFLDYLIEHGVHHNFYGEFFIDNGEITINVILRGSCYEYDYSDRQQIYFEEEFITNELNLKLSEIGMDIYDEENLTIQFCKLKGTPITRIELSYHTDHWYEIELNQIQLKVLIDFLEKEIIQAIPSFDIDFDCEITWELECEDKCLNFNYWTSSIKLKLDDIVSG
jgi:hypothetical protein